MEDKNKLLEFSEKFIGNRKLYYNNDNNKLEQDYQSVMFKLIDKYLGLIPYKSYPHIRVNSVDLIKFNDRESGIKCMYMVGTNNVMVENSENDFKIRCEYCGESSSIKWDHDGANQEPDKCIGYLPGVKYSCCGHGFGDLKDVDGMAPYIMFDWTLEEYISYSFITGLIHPIPSSHFNENEEGSEHYTVNMHNKTITIRFSKTSYFHNFVNRYRDAIKKVKLYQQSQNDYSEKEEKVADGDTLLSFLSK